MTLLHDTMLTVVQRMARCPLLVWVLLVLTPGIYALNTPQRPATMPAVNSTAEYHTGSAHQRNNRTYLAMVGPAALRFAEATPELPPEPPPPAPVPTSKQPITTETGPDTIPAIPADTAIKPTTENLGKTEPFTPDPKEPKPVSILPDDTRHEIRAEDVLPFFQFPGASDNSSTAMPFSTIEPVRARPSSATYSQQ